MLINISHAFSFSQRFYFHPRTIIWFIREYSRLVRFRELLAFNRARHKVVLFRPEGEDEPREINNEIMKMEKGRITCDRIHVGAHDRIHERL